MRHQLVVGLTALAIGLPMAPLPARAQEALPTATLRLGCHDEGSHATAAELDGLGALLEFAREHDGQPVYLDAVIAANDGAGGCSRDLSEYPDQPWPEPIRAAITFDPCRSAVLIDEESGDCGRAGLVLVSAAGPPLVWSQSVFLPAQEALPRSLPYRIGGYGDWLNYQGPFIVRHHSATGSEHATFDVPDAALPGVWDRARVNADVWKQVRTHATGRQD